MIRKLIYTRNNQVIAQTVTDVENQVHESASKMVVDRDTTMNVKEYPQRPGFGTTGRKVDLTANYFQLTTPDNMNLHRYNVKITPELKARKKFRVIELLLQSAQLVPYREGLATDFKSILISTTKISSDDMTIEIQYRSEGEDTPLANANTYTVKVTFDRTLSVDGLVTHLKSWDLGHSFTDKNELIAALNIFLNHYAKASRNITAFGSANGSKSFPHNPIGGEWDLRFGLVALRGYFSSVRPATCRLLVNVNVSNGAFYSPGLLTALMNMHGLQHMVTLERFLKFVRVQTIHRSMKKNSSGEAIPRVKTILRLARPGDGNTLNHPPQVPRHGANARDVKFWLECKPDPTQPSQKKDEKEQNVEGQAGATLKDPKSEGKDSSPSQAASSSGSGRYISVLEFFRSSTSTL